MDNRPITLIYDPITFKGGSKVATSDALALCPTTDQKFVVITADKQYWENTEFCQQDDTSVYHLPLAKWLTRHHYGVLYWIEQYVASLLLLFFIARFSKVTKLIGASGPGIDMPLYIVHQWLNIEVIQWVHGNVGCSRSIGRCLTLASAVFYLPSAKKSMRIAIEHYFKSKTDIEDISAIASNYLNCDHYYETINGIAASRWPTRCQTDFPVGFWAASLLKWKGLDTLIDAMRHAQMIRPLALNVCFIRPKNTELPVSKAPVILKYTTWHQDPDNLDEIRSQSNIFISTSHSEPFGLSILEALASGMCVLIPEDGSYWDQKLTHNVNCVKYQPNDPNSLCNALLYTFNQREVMQQCCQNALIIAQTYQAEKQYAKFAQYMNSQLVTA